MGIAFITQVNMYKIKEIEQKNAKTHRDAILKALYLDTHQQNQYEKQRIFGNQPKTTKNHIKSNLSAKYQR